LYNEGRDSTKALPKNKFRSTNFLPSANATGVLTESITRFEFDSGPSIEPTGSHHALGDHTRKQLREVLGYEPVKTFLRFVFEAV